jgi:uncharacterized membrane protein
MTDASRTARQAGSSETARKVVLLGWAAKGVVYVMLAYLVLQLAFGSAAEEASTTGALKAIAATSPGKIAIIVLGIGLLMFAIGRVLEVTTLAGPSIDGKDKVKAGVLAFVYTSLALTAFGIVTQAGSSSGGSSEQKGSAFLLGLPAGRWIVGLVGLAIIGYGAVEAYKGVKQEFLGTLRTGEMSSGIRSAAPKIGTAAYVTKGFIFVLLGYFFVQSAIAFNPNEAKGLDAALGEIAQQSWGTIVLCLVALGFLAYGAFAFLESRYRKVGSSATGMA